jgi:uncharacterized protein YjiS (DUF1127 family)
MDAYIARTTPGKSLALLGHVMYESAVALRRLARRLDRFLAARERAGRDLQDLTNMSDYELRDIGIVRASVHAVVDDGWGRDYPR